MVIVDRGQDGIQPVGWLCAVGAALHDLRRMHRQAGIVTLHHRDRGKHADIARATRQNHLGTIADRLLDRLHPHLAHDSDRPVDVALGQRSHRLQWLNSPGAQLLDQHRLVLLGMDQCHPWV